MAESLLPDHEFLNALPVFQNDMNPTAENLASLLYLRFEEVIADRYPSVKLENLTVWETPEASITVKGGCNCHG